MISAPTPLPAFSVLDDQGNPFTDKDLLGKWSVLYFYPKDETSGCTEQACSIRDGISGFKELGVDIYGISGDSVKSHQKFKQNHQLPYPLLSDIDHTMALAFATWIEKSMYGKKYMGMERSTAIIDPDGVVVAAFSKVSPTAHAAFLLEKLRPLIEAN